MSLLPRLRRSATWGKTRVSNAWGFTLVELIVVVFLIGIMLSLSIPSLRGSFFTDPLKATTRKIIGLVAGIRDQAVRLQQPYLLHFSRLENRIWYEEDGPANEKEDQGNQAATQLLLPASVRITGLWVGGDEFSAEENSVVWISKQGYLDETVIRLEDQAGNHLNLQFHPFLDPELADERPSRSWR